MLERKLALGIVGRVGFEAVGSEEVSKGSEWSRNSLGWPCAWCLVSTKMNDIEFTY